MIDIRGLDKGIILSELFNRSKLQGIGKQIWDKTCIPTLTHKQGKFIYDSSDTKYFDYLLGKVMKVDLSKDILDPYLYDRDNGQGSCEEVIKKIRCV